MSLAARIKPYAQLVRLPNVFTAAADSLAGWLLVGGALADVAGWLPLALASISIYAAGIALNDVFDFEIDLKERPKRPLPSGRIGFRFAAWLGTILLVAGPLIVVAASTRTSAIVAGLLALCVLAYDAVAKRTLLGPLFMGGCRGLNLLLGMSQSPQLGGTPGWIAAGAVTVYVMGLTCISRSETEGGRTAGLHLGIALENLGLVAILGAALQAKGFPSPSASAAIVPLEGLLILALVAGVVNLANSRTVREPTPARYMNSVKTAVLSLIWLNVGLVAAVRGLSPALAVAALWIPAYLLGKWVYST